MTDREDRLDAIERHLREISGEVRERQLLRKRLAVYGWSFLVLLLLVMVIIGVYGG